MFQHHVMGLCQWRLESSLPSLSATVATAGFRFELPPVTSAMFPARTSSVSFQYDRKAFVGGLAATVLRCCEPLEPGPITGSLGPSLKTWPLQNIWLQWINVHSNVANGISVSSKCIKLFVMGLYPRPHLKGSQHCQDPHLLLEWELGFWGQKLPYSGEAEGRVLPWHKVCYCYTVVTKISKYIVLVQISLYRNSQRCTRFCVCCDLSVVTVLCFAYDVLDIHVC